MVIHNPGRRAFTIIVGAALAHGSAGAGMQTHVGPSNGSLVQLVASSSATSATGFTFNPVSFAKVDPPPPLDAAGSKKEQT